VIILTICKLKIYDLIVNLLLYLFITQKKTYMFNVNNVIVSKFIHNKKNIYHIIFFSGIVSCYNFQVVKKHLNLILTPGCFFKDNIKKKGTGEVQ